jgi:hypothetical protein
MAIKASNQITITDITDAYSVFMSSLGYTYNADENGAISGSCSTKITARCGSNAVTVAVTQANIKFYNQSGSQITTNIPFTAAVSASSDNKTVTVTFTAASGAVLTTPIEAEIPVSVDSTITDTKRFVLSAALTGATGEDGVSITGFQTKYQLNNNSTAPSKSSGTWGNSPSIPTVNNKYLWAYDITSYSEGNPTETDVRLAAQYVEGAHWDQGTALSGTGTGKTGVAGTAGDNYLNTTTGDTYTCTASGTATTATWDYTGNIKGTPGANGKDAITISITTNNGTVFKNNSGTTTLTAKVYQGGTEVTVASNGTTTPNVGTVKWYKGLPSDTQPSGWPKSANAVTISATDVTSAQAYTCQLEG